MHPFNSPLIRRTVAKMLINQDKKQEIIAYILEHHPDLLGNPARLMRVRDCCNVLRFANYGKGKQKLHKANFCKYDKFCVACATRRAIKKIQTFIAGIEQYGLEKKHWYHITLTIRHKKHHTLEQLLDRIMTHKVELTQQVRNAKRDTQKKQGFFAQFDGIVSSIEVTYSKKNGRHPHVHILACSDNDIKVERSNAMTTMSNRDLQKAWHDITKDSHCVAMRKVDVSKNHFDRQGIAEVFKYAVKFNTLSVEHLVELIALQKKKQYRFYATTGIFRGRKIEKKDNFHKELSDSEIEYLPHFEQADFIYDEEKGIYKINKPTA